jgi:hypothetical protein
MVFFIYNFIIKYERTIKKIINKTNKMYNNNKQNHIFSNNSSIYSSMNDDNDMENYVFKLPDVITKFNPVSKNELLKKTNNTSSLYSNSSKNSSKNNSKSK